MSPHGAGGQGAARPLRDAACGARPRVLLIEDDPDSRTIYRTILLASGFTVVETADGAEGVRLASECAPDIILMDLALPGMDGWIATRILREREETASIPIVALTGHVLPEHEARAREAGCAAFLAKPIAPRTVVEEIRRILGPPLRAEGRASHG